MGLRGICADIASDPVHPSGVTVTCTGAEPVDADEAGEYFGQYVLRARLSR
ncbi:MAG: hypothetical protein WDZ57_02580 [Demequina sp.]